MEQEWLSHKEALISKQNSTSLSKRIFQKLIERPQEDLPDEDLEKMTEIIRLHYVNR